MDVLDLPFGVLVWKAISFFWFGLLLATGLWLLFTRKVSESAKRGFWLDIAYAPLGLLYDLIVWIWNLRKRKPKQ